MNRGCRLRPVLVAWPLVVCMGAAALVAQPPVVSPDDLPLTQSGPFVFDTPPEAVLVTSECVPGLCDTFIAHRHPPQQRTVLISDHWSATWAYRPGSLGAVSEIHFRFDARREGDPTSGSAEVRALARQDLMHYVTAETVSPASAWQTYDLVLRSGGQAGEPNFALQAPPLEIGVRLTTVAGDPYEYDPTDVGIVVRNFRATFVRLPSQPLLSFGLPRDAGPVSRSRLERDPRTGEWHLLKIFDSLKPSGFQDFDVPIERSVRVDLLSRVGGRLVLGAERVPVAEFGIPLGERGTEARVVLPKDVLEVVRMPLALSDLQGGIAGVPSRVLLTTLKGTSDSDAQSPAGAELCVVCLLCRLTTLLSKGDPEDCLTCLPSAPSLAAGGPAAQKLETLRRFRDQWMTGPGAANYYSELYTTLSPALGDVLLSHPRLVFDIVAARDPWLAGLQALNEGRGGEVLITRDMVWDLLGILDSFAAFGSASLRRTIEFERQRLELPALAGQTMDQFWRQVKARGGPSACTPSTTNLCLQGGRYRVEVDWEKPNGERGAGRAVLLTSDTGYFWFFDPRNVETVVKVLDGCGVNGKRWVFSAGLTNVQVHTTVVDTWTGEGKRYKNVQGKAFAPLQDTGFQECSAATAPAVAESEWSPVESGSSSAATHELLTGANHACAGAATALCLQGGRFRVEATWRTPDGASGLATAVPLTADTGYFWFFNSKNVEAVVKVLNGCGLNQRFWVFAAGLTNLRVELRVTDTHTGETKAYVSPQGKPFQPIQDTAALSGCD